jgi:hypothetical protein
MPNSTQLLFAAGIIILCISFLIDLKDDEN